MIEQLSFYLQQKMMNHLRFNCMFIIRRLKQIYISCHMIRGSWIYNPWDTRVKLGIWGTRHSTLMSDRTCGSGGVARLITSESFCRTSIYLGLRLRLVRCSWNAVDFRLLCICKSCIWECSKRQTSVWLNVFGMLDYKILCLVRRVCKYGFTI